MNNDGYDDIICGAPYNDYGASDAGKAYIILGKDKGWSRGINLRQADASFYGTAPNGKVGFAVDGVGNVNGDDIPDFAIGARDESRIYLFFGRRNANWGSNFNINHADVVFEPEQYSDCAGWRISRAGDVNADGYDDFLISALSYDYSRGKVYLILGRRSGWNNFLEDANASYMGEAREEQAGWDVQDAGDVDGDGYDDFIIGAWLNGANGVESGKAYLIKGKASNWQRNVLLSQITDVFIGENAGENAGFSVAYAGDVNGDEWGDFAISSPFNDEFINNSGKIYLFISPRGRYIISGKTDYYNNAQPVPNTLITIKNQNIEIDTTDIDGNYQFEVLGKSNYILYPFKSKNEDVGDNCISAYDAALVARHCVRLATLVEPYATSADVDHDAKITTYDAALILRYAVGYPQLPNSYVGEWIFLPDTISFTDLSTEQSNQNFNAIIRGDVNADWAFRAKLTKEVGSQSLIEKATLNSDNEVIIPISLDGGKDIISVDLQLEYDPEVFSFNTIEKCELAQDFQLAYYEAVAGVIKVGAFSITPIAEGGTFFKAIFNCHQQLDDDDYITISELRINGEQVTNSIKKHDHINNTTFQLEQNYPNPFNTMTTINY